MKFLLCILLTILHLYHHEGKTTREQRKTSPDWLTRGIRTKYQKRDLVDRNAAKRQSVPTYARDEDNADVDGRLPSNYPNAPRDIHETIAHPVLFPPLLPTPVLDERAYTRRYVPLLGNLGREQDGIPQNNFNAMNDVTKQWLFETFMRAVDKYGTNFNSVLQKGSKPAPNTFKKQDADVSGGISRVEKSSKYIDKYRQNALKNDISMTGNDISPPIYPNMHMRKTSNSYEYIEPPVNENIDYQEDITLPQDFVIDSGTLNSVNGPGCFEEKVSASTITNCVIKVDKMNSSTFLNTTNASDTNTYIQAALFNDTGKIISPDAGNLSKRVNDSLNAVNNNSISNSSLMKSTRVGKAGHMYAINISDTMPDSNDFMSINYYVNDDDQAREKHDNLSYNILRTILKNIDTKNEMKSVGLASDKEHQSPLNHSISKENVEAKGEVAQNGKNGDHINATIWSVDVHLNKSYANSTHSNENILDLKNFTVESKNNSTHSINETSIESHERHIEERINVKTDLPLPIKTETENTKANSSDPPWKTKEKIGSKPLVNNESYSSQALSYVLSLNEALSRIIRSNLKLPPESAELIKSMLVSIDAFYSDFKAHALNRTSSIAQNNEESITGLKDALLKSRAELNQLDELDRLNISNAHHSINAIPDVVLQQSALQNKRLQGPYITGISTLNELDELLNDMKVPHTESSAQDSNMNVHDKELVQKLAMQNALQNMQYIPEAMAAGPAIGENLLTPIEISIQNPSQDSSRKIEKAQENNLELLARPSPALSTNKTEQRNDGLVETSRNMSSSFHATILRDPLNISLVMKLDTFKKEGGRNPHEDKSSGNNKTGEVADEFQKGLSKNEIADSNATDPFPDFGSFIETITASMNKLYADVKDLLPDEKTSVDNSTKLSVNDTVHDIKVDPSTLKEDFKPARTSKEDNVLNSNGEESHQRSKQPPEQFKAMFQSENIVSPTSNEQQMLAHFFASSRNALQVPGIGLSSDKNVTGKEELGAFIVIPVNRGNLGQRSRILKKSSNQMALRRKH